MGALTPSERRRRGAVETAIRIAEPGLNLVLSVGDRLARLVERDDPDYYPPRSGALPPPTGEPPEARENE